MSDPLVDAFGADAGVTCLVGAGGKKTTLYALARRLDRAVVTATVRIPLFDDEVDRVAVAGDPLAPLETNDDWPLGLVAGRERDDRYRGYDPARIDDIAAAADAVLVKADGARSRLLKAPEEREPQIPDGADVVVPVASVRAVGRPLDSSSVHRPERVAALTGRDLGDEVRPEDVATVLAHEQGGLKRVPSGAAVVPLVNMVDDADLEDVARAVAAGVHDRAAVERVVLARMDVPEVVDVV